MSRYIHVSCKSYCLDQQKAGTRKLAHQSYIIPTKNFRICWTLVDIFWKQVKSNSTLKLAVLTLHPTLHIKVK